METSPTGSPAVSHTGSPPENDERYKWTWAPLNFRALLFLGLFLQAFLIVYAPHRKAKSSKKLTRLIWLAYFLADWAAGFALALISGNAAELTGKRLFCISTDLLPFWVPFILIQLGGVDTVIQSKIQEHTLSSKGAFMWCFQVGLTVYDFIVSFPKALPDAKVKLLLPMLLLLVAGITRYAEFGFAVYRASLEGLKKSMLKRTSSIQISVHTRTDKLSRQGELKSDIAVVQCAHRFFQRSRGLLIGLLFSLEERSESRTFFQKTTSEEAYKLIAVELNFIYDSLFTKALKVHSKMGYFIRTTSFSILVIALIFLRKDEKHIDGPTDIKMTYFLLYGAIALDIISFLRLIFSDWTVVALGKCMQDSCVAFVFRTYLRLKRSTLASSGTGCLSIWFQRIFRIAISLPRTVISFQRWSKSVTTFSFLDYSIKERSKTCLACFPLCKKIQYMLLCKCKGTRVTPFGSSHQLTAELWNFIFEELKRKSKNTEITDIYRARGDWVLRDIDCRNLLSYVDDYDFAQSILLWHIATEICYINDESSVDSRGHCKTLSCYMLYLLIQRPRAMFPVAGIFGEFAFRDTSAQVQQILATTGVEAEDVFREMLIEAHSPKAKPPVDDHVGGVMSKSVWSKACGLSKELMKLNSKENEKWDVMRKVWVEMLSYAASHCEAKIHADFLTQGGELVTFVWLLMAHLGIMEALVQTKEEADQPRGNQAFEC